MTSEAGSSLEVVALRDKDPLCCIPASIEVSPKQAIESADLPGLFPQSVRVYLPDIGVDCNETLVRAARRLRDHGYLAVPHLAARRIANGVALEDRIKALSEQAGVRDVLLISGDVDRPVGDISSSLEVLETGLLDRYGITNIGIAGHPEGNPNIPDDVAREALTLKASFRERSDARFRIVTQFGFDALRFISWAESLSANGIDLPVHLGVTGPAKITTLLKYAAMCGVGNSLNFLKKRAGSLVTLLNGFSPEEIVQPVERHVQSMEHSVIEQIHVFPFGGLKASATWLKERGTWAYDGAEGERRHQDLASQT